MTMQLTDDTMTVPVTSERPRRELRSRIGAGDTLRQSLTVAWRNVMQIRHSPEKLLDVILMPAVFLVLFLYVFGGVVAGNTHAYLEQLLPGLVAMMAIFNSKGEVTPPTQ
jgi:oleandomycin transport system permease protein